MKRKTIYEYYFPGREPDYFEEGFSFEEEMDNEDWNIIKEKISNDVAELCKHGIRAYGSTYWYNEDEIVQGLVKEVMNGNLWDPYDYVQDIYEPKFLEELKEQLDYEHMVKVESHYW